MQNPPVDQSQDGSPFVDFSGAGESAGRAVKLDSVSQQDEELRDQAEGNTNVLPPGYEKFHLPAPPVFSKKKSWYSVISLVLFLAFAMDHWVGIFTLVIGVVAIIFHLPPDARAMLSTPIVLMSMTFVIWVIAAGSSLFAFQNEWVAGCVGCILLVNVGSIMVGLLVLLGKGVAANLASSSDRMLAISASSIVMGTLGCTVIYWMYRRTLRREWG